MRVGTAPRQASRGRRLRVDAGALGHRYRSGMSRKPSVRLAVVDPVTGRHGGEWRVWTHKADVYIAATDLAGTLKVSLHRGVYRVAYTEEHWSTGEQPNNAPGPGRQVMAYEPSEIVDGVEYAWRVCFQCDALQHQEQLASDVAKIAPPDEMHVLQVDIWIVDREVESRPRLAIGPRPLPLADGRRVWVGYDTYRALSAPGHDPLRRDHASSMIEFLDRRGADDAPGFAVRPVDLA
jgi:hypothetical protein